MYSRVIVDTPAFYALLSRADAHHRQASRIFQHLVDYEAELYTTSYIFLEVTTLVHRRLGLESLEVMIKSVPKLCNLYYIDRATLKEAWDSMLGKHKTDLTLVDWTTCIAARKLSASVFTFHKGLADQGVLTIP